MITEAMQRVLGERVVGICDSPIGMVRRVTRALGLDPMSAYGDYVGINHLGWLRALVHDGVDMLPRLLGDDALLQTIEEGRLFGSEWLRALGAIPNEYLYYFYFNREAVEAIRTEPDTRGDFLLRSQSDFYASVAHDPATAWAQWQRVRRERDASYMKEARDESEQRDAADLAGGGYEGVALAFMAAVMRGESTSMILDVRNGTTIAGLPAEAVVEVPCQVDGTGARPLAAAPLEGHQLGLLQQMKAVEQDTIEAALGKDRRLALRAFATHPLVDSVSTARALMRGYGIG
jgi:6-phospho-beta-glucosidase